MERFSGVIVVLVAACCQGTDGEDTPPDVPLVISYTLEYPGGQAALLERPSEGRACLIVSEGVPRDVSPVRLVASGPMSAGEKVQFDTAEIVMVPDAPLAELRVVDVDGDGDDEVLIRPRGLTGDLLPPEGTPWRETLWVGDCSGVARLVVDVSVPMTVPALLVDSVHPVGGSGDGVAIATVMIGPTPFSYVLTRALLSREPPCTQMTCLPLLKDGDSTISTPQPSAWTVTGGGLALMHFDVHLTSGHLESEWYAARRDCERTELGFSCSRAADWGPLTKALARGFLDPSGDAYLRLSVPDVEYDSGAAESWSTPSHRVAHALPGRSFEPAWARFHEGRWRFGGVLQTLDGTTAHWTPVVMEQSADATRILSKWRVPGWSDERTGVVDSNRARGRSMLIALDDDRAAIAAFPAE